MKVRIVIRFIVQVIIKDFVFWATLTAFTITNVFWKVKISDRMKCILPALFHYTCLQISMVEIKPKRGVN